MITHIQVDTETLGTRPCSIVTSIAFVRFSDEAHCAFNLSIPDQEALGLQSDPATLEWWSRQDPVARELSRANPLPLASALPYIAQWISWAVTSEQGLPIETPLSQIPDRWRIWCQGANFDCPLLEEVFRRAGVSCPWQFWQVRDTRTLYDMALIDSKQYSVPPPHVALNDAIGQTRACKAAMAILARAHQQSGAAA